VIVTADPSNDGWLWLANCRFTSHRERNIVTRALQGLPLARRSFR
jgi:hypothetical protein